LSVDDGGFSAEERGDVFLEFHVHVWIGSSALAQISRRA
jgi:hypothetical protein